MSITENNIARRRLLETTRITSVSASIMVAAALSVTPTAAVPLILPTKCELYTINEVPSARYITNIAILTEKDNHFQMRTPLGKRLLAIRLKAISKGLPLLNTDEIILELSRRRGDIISA